MNWIPSGLKLRASAAAPCRHGRSLFSGSIGRWGRGAIFTFAIVFLLGTASRSRAAAINEVSERIEVTLPWGIFVRVFPEPDRPRATLEHYLSTDKPAYQLGESITITHRLSNLDDEDEFLVKNVTGPDLFIEMFYEDQLVWQSVTVWLMGFFDYRISAGDFHQRISVWHQTNDDFWIAPDPEDFTAKPGVYTLVARAPGIPPLSLDLTIIPEPHTAVIVLLAGWFAFRRCCRRSVKNPASSISTARLTICLQTRAACVVLVVLPALAIAHSASAADGSVDVNRSVTESFSYSTINIATGEGTGLRHYRHAISAPRFQYALGEPVIITHELMSIGEEPVSLTYTAGPYFEVQVFKDDQLIWAQNLIYLAVHGVKSFAPGDGLHDLVTWPMLDLFDAPVGLGVYEIRGVFHGSAAEPEPIYVQVIPEPSAVMPVLALILFLVVRQRRARPEFKGMDCPQQYPLSRLSL